MQGEKRVNPAGLKAGRKGPKRAEMLDLARFGPTADRDNRCCDSAIVARRTIWKTAGGAGVQKAASGWEIADFRSAARSDFILKHRRNITLDGLSNIHSVMRMSAMMLQRGKAHHRQAKFASNT
ncbi:hypothetical protein [Novosphingobium sp. SCN 63-17]|uniref:hypothetical protein n=1 Tax=Novosphingobium sp. SCN 63-17 TaxID=1660120 RepID=UPI001AC1F2A4|nr:hypothetical protein [Novosphingobium sp. SCN 63-17]MBN9145461.1 hypothetical protein [Novosphingobium sp.]MDR6709798.1 hypothetical protein [Novosphingobium sp. 1748]